jgi:hypothetical protein
VYVTQNQKVEVETTMDKTIERLENGKYTFEYSHKWINDCTYESIFKGTNKPNYKLQKIGEKMTVEILEIDKNQMKYSALYKGSTIDGEMTRVN